ncbi:MAG: sigma-70 family RNA polymerase sigma factor [Verrucomicrobiales bacterium]
MGIYEIRPAEADRDEEVRCLLAVAQGDWKSFRDLYDGFAGIVFAVVFRVLNDRQDAEDITQEVFALVWRKASLYRPAKGKPVTWLVTMARNRAIDHLRTRQRRFRLRNELTEQVARLEPGGSSVDLVTEACANESSRIVRGAVKELSHQQREAIELAYFSGLTQNEIAARLGEPLGTIKARIRRGVIRLHGIVSHRL